MDADACWISNCVVKTNFGRGDLCNNEITKCIALTKNKKLLEYCRYKKGKFVACVELVGRYNSLSALVGISTGSPASSLCFHIKVPLTINFNNHDSK